MKIYPLTVGMTPAFRFGGDKDWLLRAQLKCLSEQTFRDFSTLLIDCHYEKRRGYMGELAAHYKLNIVHVPYTPNLRAARKLDCSIFNAPYLFSESERIVRYSCWRFVRPNFTQACIDAKQCVDFRFHNVEPPTRDSMHIVTNHDARIWNLNSDLVFWDMIPKKHNDPGASWGPDSDRDESLQTFPLNCYGNYCVPREDWMNLNGCDEVIFSSEHWEDQDFCLRAHIAGLKCERKAHIMYRLHHLYGSHSGRANELPDFAEFKKMCDKCERVEHEPKPNRRDLKGRIRAKEVKVFGQVWVCPECLYAGPIFHADEGEYPAHIRKHRITRSNIIPEVMLGRNLRAVASDMDGKSLSEKVRVFEDSWSNPKYYQS